MTNTYKNSAPMKTKFYEEIRCTRCVLERILRVMDEGLFVDYQMEKFGGKRSKLSKMKHENNKPNNPNTGTE